LALDCGASYEGLLFALRVLALIAGKGVLMDVLSEVLRVVRLSGAIHFRGEFSQPWAFETSPPQMAAARLKIKGNSVTLFHIVTDGSGWVVPNDLPPTIMETGDVVIIPRGDQHVMASDLTVAPVPIRDIYPHVTKDHVTVLRYGGGGECSRFICGYLQSDQQFDPLLKSLPALLLVCARNGRLALETLDSSGRHVQFIEQQQEAEWWRASLRYLISEAHAAGPGNRAVVARLAETLFVEVVRWQFRYAAQDHGGWLAGLQDPQIGRVISLLHALPARPWTVDELANEAAMSRAALAKRFVELVGEPPMQYLAAWRMHVARHLLRESTLGIGEIAERVGYDSDAAFNRAFRRLVGAPPGTWRQNNDSPAQAV
jgi:AraC family transcriptional regulator, alkane utilization regulator